MPQKSKAFRLVKYPTDVIDDALALFVLKMGASPLVNQMFNVKLEGESWDLDSLQEFEIEYKNDIQYAHLEMHYMGGYFCIVYQPYETNVQVRLKDRRDVNAVFSVFEKHYERYRKPEEEVKREMKDWLKIYIGHGRSPQWRDLKDHLENHGYKVVAYETGARAGFTITEVLEKMRSETSFALLVHTGEDIDEAGIAHARENVAHETGLFQGSLGFRKAIVLLEKGCNEFSNIAGVQQLRFSKGNIKEIFGDVILTVMREFGPKDDD